MPETASLRSRTNRPCTAGPRPVAANASPPLIRGRIGVGRAGGFYPAPHRYELFLSPNCPDSQRISITLALLGLEDAVPTTLLTHPVGTVESDAALRSAYEATVHHFAGPPTTPALVDRWSGRLVSNHTADILDDLSGPLSGHGEARPSSLRPRSLVPEAEALRELLDREVSASSTPSARAAALDLLEQRLAHRRYALGDELTVADVDLWAALVHHGPTDTPHPPTHAHPHLRAYVHRLADHPAFGPS